MQRFSRVFGVVGSVALIALALTGCASSRNHAGGAGLVLTGAYVQQPASTGKTTVGYLDIRNNGAADTLLSVSTSVGGTVELRSPASQGGLVMHTVSAITVPARSLFRLSPNGSHLLITRSGPMKAGTEITLTLIFAHLGTFSVPAMVTNPATGGASYFLN